MTDRKIPRQPDGDYSLAAIKARRQFIEAASGASLPHTSAFSFDPETVSGNCENLLGTCQLPIGVAGPLRINGEHASGDFFIPLATTEGTLVASFNRGMKAITASGGITTTVFDDYMQRAPAFKFRSARDVKQFLLWMETHIEEIKREAESTSSVAKLAFIQKWPIHNILYMRWNFSTGDAAGQNMVSRATDHACRWILSNYPGEIVFYAFSGGLDTDKKHSHINNFSSRGKRVVAELVLKKEVMATLLRTDAKTIQRLRDISHQGSLLAGASYTGGQSANAIASFFIATGQDEANVVESHAGQTFTEVMENGDLYWSWTLPSIIVASYGGGTSLATQRECLEMMDCFGKGKAKKLAEIAASVVAAGDISIANAIAAGEFVNAHETYGRNR